MWGICAIARGLLDLAFPRACAGCGGAVGSESTHICWNCLAQLWPIRFPYCSICGNPAAGVIEHDYVCSLCRGKKIFFDHARSAAHYDGKLADIIQAFKYDNATYLSRDLSTLLHACVMVHYVPSGIDSVLFVPLYHRKERERTYNQAKLLAGELALLLQKPLLRNCLVRRRETVSQTTLNSVKRRKNVEDAFETRNNSWIEGRRLLLVDDIMTTGATINECARVLKSAGAVSVCAVTVARG